MGVIIGSARIDEHGHAYNGQAGDQKSSAVPDYRGEVSMQEFYVPGKGWIVARLKEAKAATKCAKSMETACNNPNIGYDQWQRYGLAPGKEDVDTKKKVETDCSALVRRCIYDATGKDVGDIRTITMHQLLPKSGLFEPLFDYKSGTTLYTGDVLFTGHLGSPVSGHTVIVVKGASRDGSSTSDTTSSKVPQPTLKQGSKGAEVKKLQKALNKLGYTDDKGNKLEEDSDFGPKTAQAVRKFQKANALEVDAIYGKQSAAKMKKLLAK